MKQLEPAQALEALCRLFGKSRQAYYWQIHKRDTRMVEELIILLLVKEIRGELKTSGVRQMKPLLDAALTSPGIHIGRDRLYRLLSMHGMLQAKKRKPPGALTTNSKHNYRVYPNLIEQMQITQPEQVFVCDITYLRLRQGFAYLSLVTDAYSRRIMG